MLQTTNNTEATEAFPFLADDRVHIKRGKRKAKRTTTLGAKRRRVVDYTSDDTEPTLDKQRVITEFLSVFGHGTVTDCATYLGISRTLMHYHLRKMAAKGLLIWMLEPALVPGGVRVRVWHPLPFAMRAANWIARQKAA